jgi:predicted esterase
MKRWDGVLDEAIWGTPSPQQAVDRNWDWEISDDAWREAVKQRGEGPLDEVAFDLWVPDGVAVVKGVVAISGHGSGENLFRHQGMRALARELHLALFKFVGNPMQRGFWPTSLLFQRLRACGSQCGHPELEHAPLLLYGHSNGTGFSAIFAANESARVWGWISMRPGITFQVYQPRAAQVPGLVIFGENDPFLLRPSPAENLAVVPTIRKRYDAVWNMAVEPKTGHGFPNREAIFCGSSNRKTGARSRPGPRSDRLGSLTCRKTPEPGTWLGQASQDSPSRQDSHRGFRLRPRLLLLLL